MVDEGFGISGEGEASQLGGGDRLRRLVDNIIGCSDGGGSSHEK